MMFFSLTIVKVLHSKPCRQGLCGNCRIQSQVWCNCTIPIVDLNYSEVHICSFYSEVHICSFYSEVHICSFYFQIRIHGKEEHKFEEGNFFTDEPGKLEISSTTPPPNLPFHQNCQNCKICIILIIEFPAKRAESHTACTAVFLLKYKQYFWILAVYFKTNYFFSLKPKITGNKLYCTHIYTIMLR